MDEIPNITFTVNNGLKRNHYINGSEVAKAPTLQGRNYTLSVDLEPTSSKYKIMYDQYFKGGSEFNAILQVNASTGSRDMFLTLSGCRVLSMPDPHQSTDTEVHTISIKPTSATSLVNDTIELYNPW